MGLTLRYTLQAKVRTAGQAKRLVEGLRQAACDLPIRDVGPLVEYEARPGQHEVFPAGFDVTYMVRRGDTWTCQPPARFVAFHIDPAAGSEWADLVWLAFRAGRAGTGRAFARRSTRATPSTAESPTSCAATWGWLSCWTERLRWVGK